MNTEIRPGAALVLTPKLRGVEMWYLEIRNGMYIVNVGIVGLNPQSLHLKAQVTLASLL